MENAELKTLLQQAVLASCEAGKLIMDIYNSNDFGVETKADDSPLTKADIASHNCIMSFLEKTGIPVLSEEGKYIYYEERKDWDLLWIVDPIDGTKEFIKRNGEFTVNIALIKNQKPIAGVVYAPAIDDLYFAGEGIGSYKFSGDDVVNKIDKLIEQSVKLPIKRLDETYMVVASRSHLSKETEDYIESLKSIHGEVKTISKGSSLKICMVAEGTADCYPRFAPTMEWDTAAGHAICKYAGFSFIDFETKNQMLYNRKELLNNWFLVSEF